MLRIKALLTPRNAPILLEALLRPSNRSWREVLPGRRAAFLLLLDLPRRGRARSGGGGRSAQRSPERRRRMRRGALQHPGRGRQTHLAPSMTVVRQAG